MKSLKMKNFPQYSKDQILNLFRFRDFSFMAIYSEVSKDPHVTIKSKLSNLGKSDPIDEEKKIFGCISISPSAKSD